MTAVPPPELEVFAAREMPRVVGTLALYCGNRDVAEELAQEALSGSVGTGNASAAWTIRVRGCIGSRSTSPIPTTAVGRLLGAHAVGSRHTPVSRLCCPTAPTPWPRSRRWGGCPSATAQARSHLYWTASIRVATYDEHCPDHILETLGPPPPIDAEERDPWAKTAFAIEQYLLRWDITDPHHTLGDQPTDPLQRADYLQTALTVTRHHREIEQTREIDQHLKIDEPELGLNIGLSR